MEKHVEIGYLLDIYGHFLTPRQRDMLAQTVNEDYSLSEIAQREGVSRQAVRDAVLRGSEQLYAMEAQLGVLRQRRALRRLWEAMDTMDRESIKAQLAALVETEEEDDGV